MLEVHHSTVAESSGVTWLASRIAHHFRRHVVPEDHVVCSGLSVFELGDMTPKHHPPWRMAVVLGEASVQPKDPAEKAESQTCPR